MNNGLYTVDFHTHLQDANLQEKMCPEDRNSSIYKVFSPVFDQIASVSEPLHDKCVRFMALNLRDQISRQVYAQLGKVGLMEVLRLFRTYSIEKLIARMDRNGIDHSVIHSIEPLTSTANILDLVRPYKERISVFASVDKDNDDPEGYLTPFIEDNLIAGLKLHPIVGRYACGEIYYALKDVVKLARDADLPVLIHTGHIPVDRLQGIGGCSEIQALEPLVREFPTVKFILAHIGWGSWREVLRLASEYPNTLVETSWQPTRVIRRAVDMLGSNRVLFGSDFPLFKQSQALEQVRQALSAREFVDVVSINSMRLLRIDRQSQAERA